MITAVEIERYRSCDRVKLDELTDIVTLAGRNNSGKSNILRALNLFFNGETDPGRSLDFDADYRLAAPSKKKKRIRVAVSFDLPAQFRFRKGLETVRELLGERFTIGKTWTLDSADPSIDLSHDGDPPTALERDDIERATQFLNLISFRYIPNRAVPVQVIREQSKGVTSQLARRLLNTQSEAVGPLLENMSLVAKDMVRPIAEDMAAVCEGMSDLELSTPTNVGDLMGQAGFRAAVGSVGNVEDTALGSGVQSLLMFHVLHMIDRGLFHSFGWRQAAIWAVEEPESSLHRELQLRLAALLRSYVMPDASRFQVTLTTHNDVFMFAGTRGFLVGLNESLATQATPLTILDLAASAAETNVTALPSPALSFPLETLVVVEGDTDRDVLTHASEICGFRGLRFATPSDLDPVLGDGIDAVKRFVQAHNRSLSQRLTGHPLLVLVDWDVSDGVRSSMASRYGTGGTLYVRKMDPGAADTRVGETFRGMERFYKYDFLEQAATNGVLTIAKTPDGRLVVERPDLEEAKRDLADRLLLETSEHAFEHLIPHLELIDKLRKGMFV